MSKLSSLYAAITICMFAAVCNPAVLTAQNTVRLYGGIGYWGLYSEYSGPAAGGGVNFGQRYRATAVYGFSYQRDLVRRLSLELDVQNSYRNTFPDIADAPAVTTTDSPGGYDGLADMPSVRDYIDRWIAAGNDPNNLTWLRHNSLAVSVRPVFHMIDTGHHRFSAYAGIGWYFADGLCFETAALFPEIEPENYTASTWQYHVSGLTGNAGLRYEYTFLEHYMVGLDAGVTFNDSGAPWQDDRTMLTATDARALLYIGFRF